jgi:hypothetical protein
MADGSGVYAYADPQRRVRDIIDEALRCFADRQVWLDRWQEIADYVIPGIADFTTQRAPAEKRMTKVYDPTQIVANEMLAAGLHGEVTNPAMKWIDGIDAVIDDGRGGEIVMDDPDVLVWCEAARDITLREFYRLETDFSGHAHEIYLSLPAIATACMFTGWNRERNCLQFQVRHMAEIAIKEAADGAVESVYRKGDWTIRQAAAKFGADKLSEVSRKKLADPKRQEEKICILHVVGPRRDRNFQSLRTDQMAVTSIYIDLDQKHVIEETGFPEMPYAVPRWAKVPGEVYGNRSPGWNSLADVKQLQLVDKDTTTYFQKMTDPNMLAPDDGFIGPYRSRPGGVAYYRAENSADAYKWWEPAGDPNASLKFADSRRDRLRIGWYLDLFDFQPQGQPLTATESNIRDQRRLLRLAPLSGRLQGEFLGPTVGRAMGLLERAYRYPPRPPAMARAKLRPRFISPIQLAQKQADLQPVYRALEIRQGIVAANPNNPPPDVVDWEEAERFAYQTAGMPARLFLTRAQVQANRDQAAQLAAAQATANAANVASQAALNTSKARQTAAETEQGQF